MSINKRIVILVAYMFTYRSQNAEEGRNKKTNNKPFESKVKLNYLVITVTK